MNWDRIEGNWKQIRGNIGQKWGKLTSDRLTVAAGKSVYLSGQIQESRGISLDEARKQRAIRACNIEPTLSVPSTPDIEIYNSPNLERYTGSVSSILGDLRNGGNP